MIYHFNSIFSGKDIGNYYNQCCDLVPDGSWICVWDADVMTFHTYFDMNAFLERVIAENTDISLFSCVANRIGTHKQRYLPSQDPNPDMGYHRKMAEKIYTNCGTKVRKDVKTVSGLMMLFSKATWKKVGGFKEEGMIAVDTEFSKKVYSSGGGVGIIQGLYVMHYYRLLEQNHNHLKK